jgi:hypothetical protein
MQQFVCYDGVTLIVVVSEFSAISNFSSSSLQQGRIPRNPSGLRFFLPETVSESKV